MSTALKQVLGWVAVIAGGATTVLQAAHITPAADIPSWLGTVVGTVGAALHLF
ncbi:MAG: hypothetical protein ACREL1_00400 [bacterium]